MLRETILQIFTLLQSQIAKLCSNSNITRPLVDLHVLVALPRHTVGRPVTVDPVAAARSGGRGLVRGPGGRGNVPLGLEDGPGKHNLLNICPIITLTHLL